MDFLELGAISLDTPAMATVDGRRWLLFYLVSIRNLYILSELG